MWQAVTHAFLRLPEEESLCTLGTPTTAWLPAIPPPRCLRQFPFVFVLRFLHGFFRRGLQHRRNVGWWERGEAVRWLILRLKTRPPFHLCDRVCNETIVCIVL